MAYVMIHSCFAFCMEEEHVELLCSWANTDVSAWCIILSDDFLFIYSYGQQSLTHFITKSLLSQLLSSGVAHLLFLKLTWGDLLCNITWKAFNIWKDGLAFFGVNRPRVTYIWSIGTCLVFLCLLAHFCIFISVLFCVGSSVSVYLWVCWMLIEYKVFTNMDWVCLVNLHLFLWLWRFTMTYRWLCTWQAIQTPNWTLMFNILCWLFPKHAINVSSHC